MNLDEIILSMLVTAAAVAVEAGLTEALRCAVAFMIGLAQGLAS